MQNNPIRYSDPTGHFSVENDAGGCYNDGCPTMEQIDEVFKKGQEKKKFKEENGCAHITLMGLCISEGGTNIPVAPDANINGDIGIGPDLPTSSVDPYSEKHPFISEMEFFSAAGDLALGGSIFTLSLYAFGASCVFAGPACLITFPIFYTTAVVGAQGFYNGWQTIAVNNDPSLTPPTGREVVDIFIPFLKKKR